MTTVVGKPNFDFWEAAVLTELDLTVLVVSSFLVQAEEAEVLTF